MARIVVCEDDVEFVRVVSGYLTARGHDIVTALDVNELKYKLKSERPFDLAIIDMQMGGGGGPAASRLLPNTPVIVLSGMPQAQQKSWFPSRSDVRFFEKPADLSALVLAIKELLPGTP